MALIRPLNGSTPSFGSDPFLAETAVVIGDVVMGHKCSVWYNAVVRGDVNSIRIGHRVNIQDGAVLHCTYQKCGLSIGDDVSIGHNAIVHGCTVEDKVLIGMGAIVMDQAVICHLERRLLDQRHGPALPSTRAEEVNTHACSKLGHALREK